MTPKHRQENNHKTGILRSFWIIFLSLSYTGYTAALSVLRGITKTSSRAWVNQALSEWVARMFRLLRITCTVHNPHHYEPKSGEVTIIMCNHSSLFDIPISYCAFPHHSIRMLAKKELSHIPLLKQAMVAAEFPFIDRKNRHQAIRDLEHVQALLKSGIIMWVAPEGTRSQNGRVGPFKKGVFITAIQAKAKIIPIGIRGAYDILPARTWRFRLNQHAEVHIGKPIDTTHYTLDNKEDLMHEVREAICQLADDH